MKPMWVVLLLVKGGNPDTMKLRININVVLFQTRALLMAFLPSTNFKFICVVAKSLFYWITDLKDIFNAMQFIEVFAAYLAMS